jgi:Flp pilus assembly protein TadB
MNRDATSVTAVPLLVRMLSVLCGTLLLATGVRLAMRRRKAAAVVSPMNRFLLVAARIARPIRLLHHSTDDATIPTRLALAPDCWVARWVAAALGTWDRHPRHPSQPQLSGLIAGVRLQCAVGFGLLVIPAWMLIGLLGGGIVGSLALAGGSALPDLVLASAARRARHVGARDTATAIDLLAATTGAGLSLPEAMVLTAGHAPPALAAALRAAAVRRAMGEEARSALADETQRFGVSGLLDIAQAVERQRRLGVALGPELAQVATRLRAEHRVCALRRAARRGPLGTVVIAVVIAPVCLASVIACVVGGLLAGGSLGLR